MVERLVALGADVNSKNEVSPPGPVWKGVRVGEGMGLSRAGVGVGSDMHTRLMMALISLTLTLTLTLISTAKGLTMLAHRT